MATIIPPITDPLGCSWVQPTTDAIILGKKTCMMSQVTFKQLKTILVLYLLVFMLERCGSLNLKVVGTFDGMEK